MNIVQGKPDGTLKTVIPQSLTYTEGHTIQFQIQVRLDGAKSAVAKLSVPAAIAHADASIVLTIEDNRSHGYRPANNAGVISLIVDSLARQAGEVGV
ncbi:hypothetical protein ABH944_006650 [Caballeronia udeis]|uniref:Uncharacterized protein n=1 Tax=Caballeronia udeis TaxID=1232866 RepID=A0ABW8MXE4_9BURK